jgi:hypothetical protein
VTPKATVSPSVRAKNSMVRINAYIVAVSLAVATNMVYLRFILNSSINYASLKRESGLFSWFPWKETLSPGTPWNRPINVAIQIHGACKSFHINDRRLLEQARRKAETANKVKASSLGEVHIIIY